MEFVMRYKTAPGFTRVTPTGDELAEWKHKNPRHAPPYRIKCDECEKRIWLSGMGIGSHRRACPVAKARRAARIVEES
jgi:hypothetical protein